jgi:hypothetical protein
LLTATLSWYDPPAAFYATNALINDLDLRITQEDTTYLPWALPTTAQQAVAVLGDNTRDNLEKVVVSGPVGGRYEITVSHKGSLQRINQNGEFENTTQKGALVLSGPGIFTTSETELELFASINSFLVAPVPAKDSFTISVLDNAISFKNIKIFGLNGREVLHKTRANFSLNSINVAVSTLTSGSYIVGIETADGFIYKQIIISN